MLGRLARWLRILGLDVTYDASLEDHELVEQAYRQNRIILTRDRRLVLRRKARRYLLIASERVEEQLQQVVRELELPVRREGLLGRCLRCNAPLRDLDPVVAKSRVPEHVARTQSRYRHCSRCDRIYWPATHVERMMRRLRGLDLLPI